MRFLFSAITNDFGAAVTTRLQLAGIIWKFKDFE